MRHETGSSGSAAAMRVRGVALLAAAVAGAAALVAGADRSPAQESPGTTGVSVAEAVDRSCFEEQLTDAPGAASLPVPAPALGDAGVGLIEARLEGPPASDWDLSIFGADGRVVAASSSAGASEVAA